MEGKIKGSALRVPIPNVSCIDLTVNVERETNEELVNEFIKYAAQTNEWRGIIKFETDPLVSPR